LALAFSGERIAEGADWAEHPFRLLAGQIATELGFALVVAPLLFAIFEEWAARHHAKTAIGLLYGIRPEGWVFDRVEDYVLKQKFYRTGTSLHYHFSDLDGDHLLVTLTSRYTALNRCAKGKSLFPVGGRVEILPLHVEKVACAEPLGLTRLKIGGKDVDLGELERSYDEQQQVSNWKWKAQRKLAYTGSLAVEAVQKFVRHDHDSEVWTTKMPCDGLDVMLTWERGLWLRFDFSAVHPELSTLEPEKVRAGARRLRLKLSEKAFLAGHGVHFRWGRGDEGCPPHRSSARRSAVTRRRKRTRDPPKKAPVDKPAPPPPGPPPG
jgi:hypothetical protein